VSRAEGAAEEWAGRKPRRVATKWLGAETEKCGDLLRTVGFVPTFLMKEAIL